MAKINLLPWREERRQELKKEFFIFSGGFALLAVVVVMAWQMYLSAEISNQQARNKFLQDNIAELDDQVKEIKDLQKKKQDLIERMGVIQSLQGNRPAIVHIFDEIVRTLPDGVFYTSVDVKGNRLVIRGTAESNNRVSSLMRSLDSSDWFSDPNLKAVKAEKSFGEQANSFEMDVKITPPVEVVSEDNKKGPGAAKKKAASTAADKKKAENK